MEQELIKPDTEPKGKSQALSPVGLFLAASGVTLLAFCLLGAAAVTTIWAFSKLIGLPDIVNYVLMALGMMMMPPTTIALPLKLLLFVLVDGWHLVVRSLVQSFA